MAKIFLALSLFLIFLPRANAQSQENKILIEEYLRRSEQQKKTGLIMLGAGLGSVVVGTVLFGTGWSEGSEAAFGSGVILFSAGAISTIISIPILVSSASNGRKAAKLGIGTSQIPDVHPNGLSAMTYPALSFSLPLTSVKP